MSRPKSRSHRQPRYKTARSPKPFRSLTADMQAAFIRRGGVRMQGGSTFYAVSLFGTAIMSVAALALGALAVFALTILPPFSDAGIAWRIILAIPPVLIWLWLTEPWWFGLTTRTFAKTTPHALILYGAFGRVRQRFDRRECTFSETGNRVPTLRVRRHNRRFSRTIDTALCANTEALIFELTVR
ncbi:hypothetical protein [Kingella denitrificans]